MTTRRHEAGGKRALVDSGGGWTRARPGSKLAPMPPPADKDLPRYEPNGRFRPALAGFTALALGGLVPLAWAYQAIVTFVPLLVKLVAVPVFAMALSLLAWMVLRAGHCRSRGLALLVGLLLSMTALGASYGWAFRRDRDAQLAETPASELQRVASRFTFSRWLDLRQERGFSVSEDTVGGWVVPFAWVVEALLLVGASTLFARMVADEPFCETCQRWSDEKRVKVNGVGREEVLARLKRKDLMGLVLLEEPATPESRYAVSLIAHRCPGCERTWVSAEAHERKPAAQGKETKTRAFVTRHLELEANAGRLLRERAWPP